MVYVMASNNKYFGLIFADTADGKSYTITRSLCFSCDSDGVSDMVDLVVDRVMNDLGDYDYLG